MTDDLLPPLTDTPAHHREAAQRAQASGDELAALAHLIAAQALEDHATKAQTAGEAAAETPAARIALVASGYFMKKDYAGAQPWYELALQLDAGQAAAWQNLAAIHEKAGRADLAARCRVRAYALQRVYVESSGAPVRRVLLLCAGRSIGNVPLEPLVPTPRNARIKYAIDYAQPDEDTALPPFDLVFNAIGDADIADPLFARIAQFRQSATQARPFLNAPDRVLATRRDRLPSLLHGLSDVETAPCIRIEPSENALAKIEASGLKLPLLVRPMATHGGEGLVRCATRAELDAALTGLTAPFYVTAFRDTRDADGACRKYRVVFVDREPLPYHLAISPHWMVHYVSAGMEGEAWKLDEERRFLADPLAALGARAWAALRAIARRIDLDYAGVDFTLLADGSVFVFEANATMLVHGERPGGPLAHKNAYVERIVAAFDAMLNARISAARP